VTCPSRVFLYYSRVRRPAYPVPPLIWCSVKLEKRERKDLSFPNQFPYFLIRVALVVACVGNLQFLRYLCSLPLNVSPAVRTLVRYSHCCFGTARSVPGGCRQKPFERPVNPP
ncbi:hypothetical protein CSUI_008782, partial [Cystoisospora suis]